MSTNRDYERIYGTGVPSDEQRSTSQQATDKAGDLKNRIVDKVDELKDRSSHTVDDLKQRSSQVGHEASDRVDSLMTATGSQMSNLAQTVRERAPQGQIGDVAHKAANLLERGGEHLKQSNPQMMRNDIERVIRDHPLEALAIGLGIGFLLRKSMNPR
jgi:ElaB/YqjD/DUF883 family membrane-anchored ribosome-binding protein